MGLDSVELLVDIEEKFDIQIPDLEAEKIATVSDFHDAVWRHLNVKNKDICHSRTLFYLLKTAFVHKLKLDTKAFFPEARLADLIPLANRRKDWKTLQVETELTFPSLVLSAKNLAILSTLITIVVVSSIVFAFKIAPTYEYPVLVWLFSLTTASIISVTLSKLFNPKRIEFDQVSVRGHVHRTLALNLNKFISNGISRLEMETIVNHIIAEKSGLSIEDITKEKRISKDLGID